MVLAYPGVPCRFHTWEGSSEALLSHFVLLLLVGGVHYAVDRLALPVRFCGLVRRRKVGAGLVPLGATRGLV